MASTTEFPKFSVLDGSAQTVAADSAVMLDAIHGALPEDAYAAPTFEGSYLAAAATPPARLRIAVSRKLPPGSLPLISADQRAAWERTATLLVGGDDAIQIF